MDIVKRKLGLYNDLTTLLKSYVAELLESYRLLYDLASDSNDIVARIESLINSLKKYKLDNAEDYFSVIHVLCNISNDLDLLVSSLYMDMSEFPSEMSNTFLLNLGDDFTYITKKHSDHKTSHAAYDEKLILLAMKKIGRLKLSDAEELFKKYNKTVALYARYLQYMFDKNDETPELLAALERSKNIVFSEERILNKFKTHSLQRYNLVPLWNHLTKDQLIKQLLGIIHFDEMKTGGGHEIEEVAELCKSKKIGLYYTEAILPNPVKFHFDTLINRKHVVKYDEFAGLNDGIILKFDNIRSYKDKVSFSSKLMGAVMSDKWVVVRSLSSGRYDIMCRSKSNVFVNKALIDKMGYSSGLINAYQSICSKKIEKYKIDPVAVVLDDKIDDTLIIDVTRPLLRHIEKGLEKDPRSLKDVHQMIHGLEPVVASIVFKSFPVAMKNNHELISTFVANANALIRNFIKSVEEGVAKSSLTEYMFLEKTANAVRVTVRNTISHIITASAKKVFDPNKGIYEKLYVKKKLLNLIHKDSTL